MKLFDTRWKGIHGIGRFAIELHRRFAEFDALSIDGKPSNALDPFRLTRYLRNHAPAFFFSPGYNAPIGSPCPFAFCIHDLGHLVVPENSSFLKRAYYRHVMQPAVLKAEAVFTVSDFSRQSICEWAEVDERKVINVGNGISEVFRLEGEIFQDFQRPYFLYVGNQRPHKNLERVIGAFAASNLAGDFAFVSVGSATSGLRDLILQLRVERDVIFVGKRNDAELAALYRGATALVLVSLYEGFGLPLVEAMACGTPIMTSSVTSMPEVVGEAAVLVNPKDIGDIVEGFRRLATDDELRRSLRIRGLQRATAFSWDITAKKVSMALPQFFADSYESIN